MILPVDDYLQWNESPEWLAIVRPWAENEQRSLYYELSSTDANDSVAVATIQGRLLQLDRLIHEPERQLERIRLENQEKELDDARRSEPGPIRRFIAGHLRPGR